MSYVILLGVMIFDESLLSPTEFHSIVITRDKARARLWSVQVS